MAGIEDGGEGGEGDEEFHFEAYEFACSPEENQNQEKGREEEMSDKR